MSKIEQAKKYIFNNEKKKAEEVLLNEAEKGSSKAIYMLFDVFYKDSSYSNLKKRFELAKIMEDKKDYKSLLILAETYKEGVVVDLDFEKAFSYYMESKIFENSYFEEVFNIKYNYLIKEDWLKFLLEKNVKGTNIVLGEYYLNARKIEKAISCFERDAKSGSTVACFKLAEFYKDGDEIYRNLDLAFEYYIKSREEAPLNFVYFSIIYRISHHDKYLEIINKCGFKEEEYNLMVERSLSKLFSNISGEYLLDALYQYRDDPNVIEEGMGIENKYLTKEKRKNAKFLYLTKAGIYSKGLLGKKDFNLALKYYDMAINKSGTISGRASNARAYFEMTKIYKVELNDELNALRMFDKLKDELESLYMFADVEFLIKVEYLSKLLNDTDFAKKIKIKIKEKIKRNEDEIW